MTSEGTSSGSGDGMLKTAEQLLRKAITQYGVNHPVVLERLSLYVELMQQAGKGDKVKELAEQEKHLRIKLNMPRKSIAASASDTRSGVTLDEDIKIDPDAGEIVTHFYSSQGAHIATLVEKRLYSPSGRFLADWRECEGIRRPLRAVKKTPAWRRRIGLICVRPCSSVAQNHSSGIRGASGWVNSDAELWRVHRVPMQRPQVSRL